MPDPENTPAEPVRKLSFIGIGNSGDGTLSERVEEILEEEWS